MHEIKVWHKKSRTKGFSNSPRLRPGTTIIQQNNLLTLKKNKGNESVFFSRLKRRIDQENYLFNVFGKQHGPFEVKLVHNAIRRKK
jgi:hypothetical protein